MPDVLHPVYDQPQLLDHHVVIPVDKHRLRMLVCLLVQPPFIALPVDDEDSHAFVDLCAPCLG
eukprot:82633-Lingulodinium_polyedra.AAC.1